MKITSNCPLCTAHELHVVEENNSKFMQCLDCGYATSDKFKMSDEKTKNAIYDKLTYEMKKWSKECNGSVWIPGMLTLPEGMIYPVDKDGVMMWGYSKMVDIPEDEQKNYKNSDGGFYEKRYDQESSEFFETFKESLAKARSKILEISKENKKIELPKLKKIND